MLSSTVLWLSAGLSTLNRWPKSAGNSLAPALIKYLCTAGPSKAHRSSLLRNSQNRTRRPLRRSRLAQCYSGHLPKQSSSSSVRGRVYLLTRNSWVSLNKNCANYTSVEMRQSIVRQQAGLNVAENSRAELGNLRITYVGMGDYKAHYAEQGWGSF